MLNELKDIVARSRGTLVEDALGALSLLVILMASLSLPAFV
ncbi:hypothetical protein [Celeribacter sp.]